MHIPAYADAFVAVAVDNAAAAMESAGLESAVIKLSNPTPTRVEPDSGFSANRLVLERMSATTMPYAVVEPTMFLDTFLKPNLRREISVDHVIDLPVDAALKIAWTTVDDAARLAVCALQSKCRGLTLRCAGAKAFDGNELAAAFSTMLGNRITYRRADLAAFQRDIEAAIGTHAAAPVVGKFRFLSQFPEEARRMLRETESDARAVPDFAPTALHDWIATNYRFLTAI